MLLREADLRIGLTSRLADCFIDYRNPLSVEHSVQTLLARRVYGVALGYEDLSDHNVLRSDSVLAMAIDKVRSAEAQRMAQDGYQPVLKKSRWCLLKRRANLTDTQRLKLRDLLRYNLQSVRAYLLKEDFQQFWDYDSPTWAGKFLDQWCTQVMRSRIAPMKKFARTLRTHRELLLNYFRARKAFSSGVIEGMNNKAKLTMRKAYGFRTFRITELSLYHALGKLPEPKLTHSVY